MPASVQTGIFNTVPKHDVFGFYHNGKLKYKDVASAINFNRQEISQAARVAVSSVRYEENKIPDKMKDFLQSITWLLNVSYESLKDKEKVVQWFNLPNPACGGFSPKDMICMGQYKKLMRIVSSYMEGQVP